MRLSHSVSETLNKASYSKRYQGWESDRTLYLKKEDELRMITGWPWLFAKDRVNNSGLTAYRGGIPLEVGLTGLHPGLTTTLYNKESPQ